MEEKKTSKEILPESEREDLFWKIAHNDTNVSLYTMQQLPKALLSAEREVEELKRLFKVYANTVIESEGVNYTSEIYDKADKKRIESLLIS